MAHLFLSKNALTGTIPSNIGSLQLMIDFEIDGNQYHDGQDLKDEIRQKALEQLGIRFLRISAQRVLKHPNDVAQLIIQICTGEINLEDLEPQVKVKTRHSPRRGSR